MYIQSNKKFQSFKHDSKPSTPKVKMHVENLFTHIILTTFHLRKENPKKSASMNEPRKPCILSFDNKT